MRILKKLYLLIGYGFATMFFVSILGVFLIAFLIGGSNFSLIGKKDLKVKSENAIGVVELTGESFSSEKFTEQFAKQVDNDDIKAVVVRIDSPGGSVGASEELFQIIKDAGSKKPIVCSLGNIAASGGLFAACGCQKIVANRGSLTGSIGVIMMMPQFSSVINKLGVGMNVIKSGQLKDSGSPFREMTAKDREVFQAIVDMAYEQFVDVIATSRNLTPEAVKEFADGRIILGEEAKRIGLIDEVGGLKKAAEMALQLAGLTGEPEIIRASKKKGLAKFLDEGVEGLAFINWLRGMSEFRLFYRSGF